MNFTAQVKEVKRLSTVSNDVEYRVVLISDSIPEELFTIAADVTVDVIIKVNGI